MACHAGTLELEPRVLVRRISLMGVDGHGYLHYRGWFSVEAQGYHCRAEDKCC